MCGCRHRVPLPARAAPCSDSSDCSFYPTTHPPTPPQVGNAKKQKWLHALGLTPASEMSVEALTSIPEGSTECPFEVASKKRRWDGDGGGDGVGSWRQKGCLLGCCGCLLGSAGWLAHAAGAPACLPRSAEEAAREDERLGQQDWRWQQRGGKRQQRERAPVAAPSYGESFLRSPGVAGAQQSGSRCATHAQALYSYA